MNKHIKNVYLIRPKLINDMEREQLFNPLSIDLYKRYTIFTRNSLQ